ncbi:citrate synthase, partial [Nowakowskiella sp. JEL0078]
MSAKAIREYDGKHLLAYFLPKLTAQVDAKDSPASFLGTSKMVNLAFDTSLIDPKQGDSDTPEVREINFKTKFLPHVHDVLDKAESKYQWIHSTKLVVKPDQLIKRRGKHGLVGINLDWAGVKEWVLKRAGKVFKLEKTSGYLHTFLVEPFVPHSQDTEYYIAIQSQRDGDLIYFTHEGGVDVGDVDAKAKKLLIPVNQPFPIEAIKTELLSEIKSSSKISVLVDFISRLYAVYADLHFTYLEINPLVVLEGAEGSSAQVYYLDLAAKIDQTAEFEVGKKWGAARLDAYSNSPAYGPVLEFPAPFGRELTKEEAYIAELDAKTGASLKLTVLNPNGRVWTMVAGGGASVVYTDAIAALGYANEIANYGEYSGAPSESQTYEYAKTILDLMTRGTPHPEGKFLFIGGGIANFTNVSSTFKGVVKALKTYHQSLIQNKVKILVRRAGPNYQEGLRLIRNTGESLGLDIEVYGPEMFVTGIVPLALKNKLEIAETSLGSTELPPLDLDLNGPSFIPFSAKTRSFIYGMQPRAVQGMLDFDFMCGRQQTSVACMIYPFGGHHVQKFYWGTKETLLPVHTSIADAIAAFPEVDVAINFASMRSVYDSTKELLAFPQIKTIAIIAEGVPERRAREILHLARAKGVLIVGPATV